LFRKILPEWVQPYAVEKEKNPDEGLFTAAALQKRDPDYISVYSWNYQVSSQTVRRYYGDLSQGNSPTQWCSMPRQRVCRRGFIRERSISWPAVSPSSSGKIEPVSAEITALSAESRRRGAAELM